MKKTFYLMLGLMLSSALFSQESRKQEYSRMIINSAIKSNDYSSLSKEYLELFIISKLSNKSFINLDTNDIYNKSKDELVKIVNEIWAEQFVVINSDIEPNTNSERVVKKSY